MKTPLLIAAAAMILSAPAVAESPSQPAAAATTTTFEGWVRFSGEEFQLIAEENRYRGGFARPCVSGALPRDLQRQASRDIGGQKVRITGVAMPWSDDLPGDRYTHEGSNIRNECESAVVILATEIDPIA